jgi:hypothetical protein
LSQRTDYFFFHRFAAAFAAIWDRFFGASAAARQAALQAAQTAQSDRIGVLVRVYRPWRFARFSLRSFPDGFEEDPVGEFIWIARAVLSQEAGEVNLKKNQTDPLPEFLMRNAGVKVAPARILMDHLISADAGPGFLSGHDFTGRGNTLIFEGTGFRVRARTHFYAGNQSFGANSGTLG